MGEIFASLLYEHLMVLFLFGLQAFVALAQKGFISIDCGATESYTDARGIEWIPDDEHILTGGTAKVLEVDSKIERPLRNLRFFETRMKNCYVLQPVTEGSKYLIRATFLYGNYDNLNVPPSFDMLFDANPWILVNTYTDQPETIEMITLAQGNSISVCLARLNPNQNPFISSLELRLLSPSMYDIVGDKNALISFSRLNFGGGPSVTIRYPDDPFDRIWIGDNITRYPAISTTRDISTTSQDQAPPAVMQTAKTTHNASEPMTYIFNYPVFDFHLYIAGFFAEIQTLGNKDTRMFSIHLNNLTLNNGYSPISAGDELYTNYSYVSGRTKLTLAATEGSTLSPLLNAWDIYAVIKLEEGTFNADVEALNEIKKHFHLESWTGDPCMPFPYSWEWLNCSAAASPRVTALKLSESSLNGTIPESIAKLTALSILLLANNNLEGEIPDLSPLKELRILELQHNKLSGPIPDSLMNPPKLTELNLADNNFSGRIQLALETNQNIVLNISGNSKLCKRGVNSCIIGSTSPAPSPGTLIPTASKKESGNKGLITGLVVAGVIVFSLALIGYILYWMNRKKGIRRVKYSPAPANYSDFVRPFTYSEVRMATKDFQKAIGKGGFGEVFHGRLLDGREIAVKCLSLKSHQGENEFSAEVVFLSRVHHKNLVSLIGYCSEAKHRILIYEYMQKGNLRSLLYGPNASSNRLDWITRLDIAVNAAQGLEYLHTGHSPIIIHRDVKSDNILLNERLLAKVSDFGLSKRGPVEGASHVPTLPKGTIGYLDPEYYVTNQLTEKSDVYSFGVLLLEIICGRQPVDNHPPEEEERSIVEWVRLMISQGNIEGIVDPMLRKKYKIAAMWKVVELAMACLQSKRVDRPTMSEVVMELKESITLQRAADFPFSNSRHNYSTSPIPLISSSSHQFTASSNLSDSSPRLT